MRGDFNDKLVRLIISGFTLTDKGEILVAKTLLVFKGMQSESFPPLISQNKKSKTGKWRPFDSTYFHLDSIPIPTRQRLGLDFNEELLKELLVTHGNCKQELVLDSVLKTAYISLLTEITRYKKYIINFYEKYNDNKTRHAKALTFAILRVILPIIQKFPRGPIKFFYNLLREDRLRLDAAIKEASETGFQVLNVPPTHEIPLTGPTYFSKYLNRMLREGIPAGLIHKGKGKPSNRLKLTPVIKDVIIYLKSHGNPTTGTQIHADLKNLFKENKKIAKEEKLPDVDTVREFLDTDEAKSRTMLANQDFAKFERRILGYLPLKRPRTPLAKVTMDGYYVQAVNQDDNSETTSMVGFFIRDGYSGVTISDFGDAEEFGLIGDVFEKYLEFNEYKFPAELVCDTFTDRQTKHFPNFRKFIEESGVLWHAEKSPKAKSPLERFNGVFQTIYLSMIVGYKGEGVTSKREYAHPSREVKMIIRAAEYVKNKNEMRRYLLSAVDDYNQNAFYDHAQSPMALHKLKKPVHYIQLQPYHAALFFWNKHEVTVEGCIIAIREKKKGQRKKIWLYRNDDFDFSLKNGAKVDAYHNPKKDKSIFVFERNTSNFIISMERHFSAREAKVEQTATDKKRIATFGISKQNLHQRYIDELDAVEKRLSENGINPETLRKEARFKKEADEYDGYKTGITPKTKEPNLFKSHHLRNPSPRSKTQMNSKAVQPRKRKNKLPPPNDTF